MDLPAYEDWQSLIPQDDDFSDPVIQEGDSRPFLMKDNLEYDTETHVQVRCLSHQEFPTPPESYHSAPLK